MRTKLLFPILICAWLGACSIGQEAKRAANVYDFGMPTQAARIPGNVILQDVGAPSWLATPALHYRLAYQDIARLQTYADSRWAAAPATLLTLRMHQALGATANSNKQYQLRIELEEFSHVFDTPGTSRGLVRARASLIVAGARSPIATRTFTIERKAPSSNSEGGVRALTEASDALIDTLAGWLTETTAETAKK
jgi:cholesterol transport system auxiliary component